MRIIAGKWRGTPLQRPQGTQTRPVLDQVKEALFNILGTRLALPGVLPSVRVLDLFSGTGSMGLEALSRGAAHCTFCEQHRPTARSLCQNIERLNAGAEATVITGSAWNPTAAWTGGPFEIVFVDPPYKDARTVAPGSLVARLFDMLHAPGHVADDGLVVFRHPVETTPEIVHLSAWRVVDQRSYGTMTLSLMTRTTERP